MNPIFLEQAQEQGFNHQAYSQFPPTGEVMARMDFISWFCTTQVFFFRQVGSGIRFYVRIGVHPHIESMSVDALSKFIPHVQRGDLCRFRITQSSIGQFVLQHAEIVEQLPICTRRGQCQPSPCCVFKS